jgi:hypothetical protein
MIRKSVVILLVFSCALLAGCTLPFGPTPTPSPTATELILPSPVPTNTPPPTATFPPPLTPTPLPSNTPIPNTPTTVVVSSPNVTAQAGQVTYKVRFPAGRTGVQLSSTLGAGETHRYLVRAQVDQSFLAEIFTARQDLRLALFTEAGALLPPLQNDLGFYEWRLPSNQEFRLDVIGSGTAAEYRLAINIPRIVRFPVGTFGTTERGEIGEGETIMYRLRATPGQTMTLKLTNTSGASVLGVYGLEADNQILSPDEGKIRVERDAAGIHALHRPGGGDRRWGIRI